MRISDWSSDVCSSDLQNGDQIIDQRDQRIIGHGIRTQYSLYMDIRYKHFGLYVLGIGKAGNSSFRSGNYNRVFGNVKSSEMANYAYGPDNKIGRAARRKRVCQYVSISVGAGE